MRKNNNTLAVSTIKCNESVEGETIEEKIKRAMENDEPIEQTVDLIFTERAEGVHHEFNPKGDKWAEAVEAIGNKTKSQIAQRKDLLDKKALEEAKGKDTPATGGEKV